VLILVILNEARMMKKKESDTDFCQYLCVSTLQHWTAYMISTLLCLGAVTILSLSVSFPVCFNCALHVCTLLTERCRSSAAFCFLQLSFSFIHAQIIRAWVICIRPWRMDTSTFKSFWHSLCPLLPGTNEPCG
jgi:hypothetical protein